MLEKFIQETAPQKSLAPENEVKKAIRGTLSGSAVIGEHGENYRPEPPRPTEAEAILSCGHRLEFPVAPITGEYLWCAKCESWEPCRVPGGFLIRCQPCGLLESTFGHNATLALARARVHGTGKGRSRKAVPHPVEVGKYTPTGITWKPYEKGLK